MAQRWTETDLATFIESGEAAPEQRLWRAVIVQAVQDATQEKPNGASSGNAAALARKEARDWFRHGDRSFVEVCSNAGLEPVTVREGVLAYFDAIDSGKTFPMRINRYMRRPEGVDDAKPKKARQAHADAVQAHGGRKGARAGKVNGRGPIALPRDPQPRTSETPSAVTRAH